MSKVFNLKMKRFKGHFWLPSTRPSNPSQPSNPSNPIKPQFIKEIPLKFKNWNCLQFYKRNPFKNFSPSILQRNFLMKSRLLDWFSKNPTKRVFLIFFIWTPNLSKFLNPLEICWDNFFMYMTLARSLVRKILGKCRFLVQKSHPKLRNRRRKIFENSWDFFFCENL